MICQNQDGGKMENCWKKIKIAWSNWWCYYFAVFSDRHPAISTWIGLHVGVGIFALLLVLSIIVLNIILMMFGINLAGLNENSTPVQICSMIAFFEAVIGTFFFGSWFISNRSYCDYDHYDENGKIDTRDYKYRNYYN